MPYDPSKAALDTLVATFWTSKGWVVPPAWPEREQLKSAIKAGVMFGAPAVEHHKGWLKRTQAVIARTDPTNVQAAFIASLSGERLDLRSALGSYAFLRHLPKHKHERSGSSPFCSWCGLPESGTDDLNVLNFERFKWGGVRHTNVIYATFDLEQFALAPRLEIRDEELETGRALIAALRNAPAQATATQLIPTLTMLKGNKDTRAKILDILAICGILRTDEHPGYLNAFVRYDQRPLPPLRNVEREYPLCWWRGSDGVNDDALLAFLPQLAA